MPRMIGSGLSRREREILEVLHRLNQGSVGDVLAALEEAPSYSAVRTLLRILEAKGHVTHREDGRRYVYVATQPRSDAAQEALRSVVETFFDGSSERAIHALVSGGEPRLSETEFQQQFERMSERVMVIHQEQEREAQQGDQRERMASAIRNLFDSLRNRSGAEATEAEMTSAGQ